MKRLIGQVMDIRKHEVEGFQLKVEKKDVIKFLERLKTSFNDLAEVHQINYRFKAANPSLQAWFDSEILEKIVLNLLSNAFKFTPDGGEIEFIVESEIIQKNTNETEGLAPGQYIKCTVKDNGIGIPKKELTNIFNRYYQATNLKLDQHPGTGIGMELVHKLTMLHHGFITVESQEGSFTAFQFYIPIEKRLFKQEEVLLADGKSGEIDTDLAVVEPPEPTGSSPEVHSLSKKPIILIIEDNQELREMVSQLLGKSYIILEAGNGKAGFELVTKHIPDLIISDIYMPVEDGVSFLKKVKETDIVAHLPVIMLTARNTDKMKLDCTKLGAQAFIEKPFSLEFLDWKVKSILRSHHILKNKYSKTISTKLSPVNIDSPDEKFVHRLIQIIEEEMGNSQLNVESLAESIGMSRANLYRKVNQLLGMSPVSFIKTTRLKRAAQLLRENKFYVSEVGYMVGFKNQKYFSRCFHTAYGKTPTEYAKMKIPETETYMT